MNEARPSEYVVTIARSAFSVIPWIGGVLNEIIFDHRSRVKQRRFEEFVIGLADDVQRIGEGAVDQEFLLSEEFGDLLEATLRRVVSSGRQEKRDRLRRVLVRQLQAPLPSDYQELFLDLVSEVSEKEIEILDAFREAALRPRREDEPEQTPKMGLFREPEHYGLEPGNYRFMLQHLIARGLLYDDSIGRWSVTALKLVEITDLGSAFLDFIEGSAT
jgi:hypothetical protein